MKSRSQITAEGATWEQNIGYQRSASSLQGEALWKKKYDWRITWPGERHEDWSAYDGELYIGRIMRDLTTHNKKNWFMWSGGAFGRDFRKHLLPHQGWEQEHWQAAKAVEDWYDRLREINRLPPMPTH